MSPTTPSKSACFTKTRGASSSGSLRRSASDPGDYDLRSNKGGLAVSGEITLHADRLYVQASQPATGANTGILFRSCEGRRDYIGGANNFASLDLLHEPAVLAHRVRAACLI